MSVTNRRCSAIGSIPNCVMTTVRVKKANPQAVSPRTTNVAMVKKGTALTVAASTFWSMTIPNLMAAAFADFWTRLRVSIAMVPTTVPEPAMHIVKAADTNGHSLAGYPVSHNTAGNITITGKDNDSTLMGKVWLFLVIAVAVLVFAIMLTPITHVKQS